jgi:error-prone DNA polymerase
MESLDETNQAPGAGPQVEETSAPARGPSYAELHCATNFTFLTGASHPHELVERAVELGYHALAITDECSVAGVVRAHEAAKDTTLRLIVGSEFRLVDGTHFVLLATERAAYGRLCRLITRARRAADKGTYRLTREQIDPADLEGCLALWLAGDVPDPQQGEWLKTICPERTWLAIELLRAGDDRGRLAVLTQLGKRLQLSLVASGGAQMHVRERRALQDLLTAIRLNTPITEVGYHLQPSGERHLRHPAELERLYPRALLEETLRIAERCRFSLEELRYEYPEELVPAGESASGWLRRLTEDGARWRWPEGVPEHVRDLIEHELALIAELRYEAYFLTVHDLVRFARSLGILCQGRGSAANSTVCYCLGVTSVDPARQEVLFERFISRERNEPPDIDIDFEHERREEVIQYVYQKYGRHRAAIAATLITYQPRSALRDVGKAMGLDALQVERLAHAMHWWDGRKVADERVREAGFEPGNPLLARLLERVHELIGFPRHLSQHVGGFVISRGPLEELVPIENATMPDRTVIQWDKDDLDALGLLKVDVLGLGMLSALRKSLELLRDFRGREYTLASIPAEDPAVYAMIQRADTVGVFQIESRAQMSMLPRLKPKNFYDLVIEVAIVRPGPIQGDMVHPYLRRRNGEEPESYPSREVEKVLKRTLGVPIFQEQVMQLAMVAAGFTPGEADDLRRSMAAWKRRGGLERFEERLLSGMRERGYKEEFAARIFRQIQGFGEYGFPESHATSFALLAYASAWIKCHEPAIFTCALLNSLPMGFYAPAQLVRDARAHGVEVRPVDVLASERDCTLERRADGEPALRLGLRLAKGLSEAGAERLAAARRVRPFASVQDLAERAQLERRDLNALADAGACARLAGNRHRAVWEVAGVESALPIFPGIKIAEGIPMLAAPTEGQNVLADYRSLSLTLGRHPLALLRERLRARHLLSASDLSTIEHGARVSTAGLVITRQRPSSASGVIFITLEDETGQVNLIVWPGIAAAQRRHFLEARLLEVHGELQRQGEVMHVIAARFMDLSRWLGTLAAKSRDFR